MTDLPQCATLDLEPAKGWLTVWFNDPGRRNPLTGDRVAEITMLCAHLRTRPDIRGVTFRGRGGVFCAGGDLRAFRTAFQGGGGYDQVHAASLAAADMFDAIATLPQFTVMAVEGAAMAGGVGLACTGDLVIAARAARFGLSETRIGLTPAQIAPYVVQRVGLPTARRLMMTGAMLTAEQAREIGLVDELADGDDGIDATLARVRAEVLKAAPGAVAAVKTLVAALPRMTRDQQRRAAAEDFAERMLSDEAREGIASFFEKRPPKWAEG